MLYFSTLFPKLPTFEVVTRHTGVVDPFGRRCFPVWLLVVVYRSCYYSRCFCLLLYYFIASHWIDILCNIDMHFIKDKMYFANGPYLFWYYKVISNQAISWLNKNWYYVVISWLKSIMSFRDMIIFNQLNLPYSCIL